MTIKTGPSHTAPIGSMCQASRIDTSRILVINPNTNPQVTREIRRLVRQCSPEGVQMEVTNPLAGPIAIENAAHKATATREVMALIQQRQSADDVGYIMACFDDLAVQELRDATQRPVVSLAEAGMRAAGQHDRPFTVITTFEGAVETIRALSRGYGLDARCRIVATGMGVSETAARTPQAEQRLHDAIVSSLDQGANAIVLGSGAFVGRAALLSERYGIDITDGLSDAIRYVHTPLLTLSSEAPAG